MDGKKSLKDISWQVTEEEYRADPSYSYSTIAKFDREGFEKIDTLFDKVESPSLLFGSCVDTLLTDGQEAFDARFFVADFPEIADNIKKIVDSVFKVCSEEYTSLDKVPDAPIIMATEMLDYQKNWKPETRAKVIREKGYEYYNLLYLAGDKTVITSSFYADVLACIEELKTSEATKWYFQDNDPFDDNIERLYQLKFKGKYKDIPLRGMLDLCIVNHEEGTIQPIDLKTTKDINSFEDSFYKFKYYHQAQIYSELIRQNIKDDPYFYNFKILPYLFIAIDKYKKIPIIYKFSSNFCKTALYIEDKWQKNWREVLKELDWHLKHSDVKMPYKMYVDYVNNKGLLNITKYLNGYLEDSFENDFPVEWKDVVGWEGYYKVSNTGKVLRLERQVWSPKNNSFSIIPEKLLPVKSASSGLNHKSYSYVVLTRNAEIKKRFVHRLVAEAFIPNPKQYPVVNHKDENSLNNNASNLEWCTEEYNTNYGTRNTQVSIQLGVPIQQFDLEGNFINEFVSAAEACRKLGWPPNRQSNISAVCRGVRKSSLGYIWKFKNV